MCCPLPRAGEVASDGALAKADDGEGQTKAAWRVERKTEGMFPSGLRASMRQCENGSGFGSKPNLEAQRFWPDFGTGLMPHRFSQWKPVQARTRRGARHLPSCRRKDLRRPGAGCYSTEAAGIVISLGHALGSRRQVVLCHSPAGAAHGSGRFDKLATLTPPFQNHRDDR